MLRYLRPRPSPPLGGAHSVVAHSPHFRSTGGAVFAVDRPVGAIVQRLHALHRPGLVAELPTGFTAGSPVFYHPPLKWNALISISKWEWCCNNRREDSGSIVAYMGWMHSCMLQRLRMGLGFLLVSQKVRWTNRLSLFLLHPYFVYCTPSEDKSEHNDIFKQTKTSDKRDYAKLHHAS